MVASATISPMSARNFSQKLREIRALIGWSQTKLAEAVGDVSQFQVSRWEVGTGEPNLDQLDRLVDCLARHVAWVTLDYLVRDSAVATGAPGGPAGLATELEDEILRTLVRDLGPVEARRRLIGAGISWTYAEDQPPRVIRPIRSITRRAGDLPPPETRTGPDQAPALEAPKPDPGPGGEDGDGKGSKGEDGPAPGPGKKKARGRKDGATGGDGAV